MDGLEGGVELSQHISIWLSHSTCIYIYDRLETKMVNIILTNISLSKKRIAFLIQWFFAHLAARWMLSLILAWFMCIQIVYILPHGACWHESNVEDNKKKTRSINVVPLEAWKRNNNNQSTSFMITSSHHSLSALFKPITTAWSCVSKRNLITAIHTYRHVLSVSHHLPHLFLFSSSSSFFARSSTVE